MKVFPDDPAWSGSGLFLVLNVPLLWLLGVSFYRYKVTAARPAQYVGFENFTRYLEII